MRRYKFLDANAKVKQCANLCITLMKSHLADLSPSEDNYFKHFNNRLIYWLIIGEHYFGIVSEIGHKVVYNNL